MMEASDEQNPAPRGNPRRLPPDSDAKLYCEGDAEIEGAMDHIRGVFFGVIIGAVGGGMVGCLFRPAASMFHADIGNRHLIIGGIVLGAVAGSVVGYVLAVNK